MAQYSALLTALGLYNETNQLSAPVGAMITASNIIIRRDNVIEPRRGFQLYGTPFGTSTDVAEQLMEYQNVLIRQFNCTLQWDTGVLNALGQNIFDTFAGTFCEAVPGVRTKWIEANNNLYFTSSAGIQKISGRNISDFSSEAGFITPAGGIPALGITTSLNITYGSDTGILPDDSVVAYRVLWGYTDINGNLILGTPSSPSIIYNPLSDMIVRDMMVMLYALDQLDIPGSRITDADYVSTYTLPLNASALQIITNLEGVAVQLDLEQGTLFSSAQILQAIIANGNCVVTVINDIGMFGKVSIGDIIYVNGFSVGGDASLTNGLNGPQTVTDVENGPSQQVTTITTLSAAGLAQSGPGSYFTISNANNVVNYYVWYAIDSATDPMPAGLIGIQVTALDTDSPQTIAIETVNAINAFVLDFQATNLSNIITITNVNTGAATDAADVNTGFTFSTPVSGATIVGSITFTTTATGVVTLSSANIQSGQFRGITQPIAPSIPTTDAQLVSIQNYLLNIILELQSIRNLKQVANFNEIPSQYPLLITTASVTSNVLTINFDVSLTGTDAQNEFEVGDLIELVGTFTGTGSTNLDGVYTVSTVTNSTVTMVVVCPNGTVTVDTTSVVYEILRFTNAIQATYINFLTITRTANVNVTITIPPGVTVNDFFQIYRGDIAIATGTDVLADLVPDDEMVLVYEGYPTAAEIAAGFVTVEDITPDSFTQGATDLYTNEISGQGILQENNAPPFATDINVFQGYTWYSNTSTLQSFTFNLLGVQQIITDYLNGLHPSITITNGITTQTYTFVLGVSQITNITTTAGSTLASSGVASYFLINGGNNDVNYYVWYSIGTATDPMIPGATGIQVFALTGDTSTQIASKTTSALNIVPDDFSATSVGNVITVTNVIEGISTPATPGTSGFTISVVTPGAGENAALNEVLLSNSVSPSLAVTETAESLINIINQTLGSSVSAYYLSGIAGVPGSILLEANSLADPVFYILTNTTGTGLSFSPSLAPFITGITNTAANPTVITAPDNGLVDGQQVVITGSNSTPSINGLWTVDNVTTNTFTIPVDVTVAGTTGSIIAADSSFAQNSTNSVTINRIFYSKLQQPEAVPLLNYIDIGSNNKAILRIFPLRDSLFVFKEDGLFRISGQVPPWSVNLFDSTVKLVATDSLGLANNLIYGWSKEGIVTVSEAGKQLISRPIDVLILPLSSSGQYTNFSTATWGIGYESDNSYYVFTVSNFDDVNATICYRYSNLTNTWTTYNKTDTCGLVKFLDDKLYLGAGDTNFLEVERKNFDRTDYADRQYVKNLLANDYFNDGMIITLDSTQYVSVGDVLTQDQTVSVYTFNQLLQKLDLDPSLLDKNYYLSLQAIGGDNMRDDLVALADKLDNDPGRANIDTFLPSAVNTGTSVITITNHGFVNGDVVMFSSTGTLPAGLNDTDYFFIIGVTTNTFQVSATYGGIAISLTTQGTGVHTIQNVEYQYSIIDQISFPIISNSNTNPTIITSTNNGLVTGRVITITGNTGSSPSINGTYTVTSLSANTFSIPVNVTTPGTGGAFTTLIDNFNDIEASYNIIIANLNADPNIAFDNYTPITDITTLEAIITAFNPTTGAITLNIALEWVQGPMTLYESIDSTFTYSPLTLNDPIGYKQIREAELLFQNKTFTTATMSFSTDLLPEFQDVPFSGLGNGLFGNDLFGANYFGGNSHSTPFRTYVPRQCQRCRYINIKFDHNIAREMFSIYGASVTARVGMSGRAYR